MNLERVREQLRGISAIALTPFHHDLTIDMEAVRANAHYLAENKIETVVACGNTGEYYSLSLEEAQATAEAITAEVRRANPDAAVLVGVGYAAEIAVKLARHAQEFGADGIMIHQPVMPYASERGHCRYFTQIAQAVDIGVVLYVRDPIMTPALLKQILCLPNVVGVKYAINNVHAFADAVQCLPTENVVWVCGLAEGWAPFFWSAGAQGFTSGLANVAPHFSRALLDALKQGNQSAAMDLWRKIKPFEDLRARHANGNNVPVVKEAMQQLNLCGVERWVRPPISELTDLERDEVDVILCAWDMV